MFAFARYGWVALACFAWAGGVCVGSASAQDPVEAPSPEILSEEDEVERPEDAPAADAPGRAAYFRGLAAADEQRWDDALAAFEESFRESNRTPLMLNIAVAQQALARYVAAAGTIERLRMRDDIDTATFRAAEALSAELDARIAVLDIQRPTGSSLRIDGSVHPSGRVLVNPGTHVIEVEHVGFLPHREEVEALPGQVLRVGVTLLPRETVEIDPRRRRRRILGVVGAAVVIGVGAAMLGILLRSETAATPNCPPRDLCFEVRP